jgi:hypothetical protein
MSFEQQLRSASDTLMGALEQMHALESEKRAIPAGSKRFVELARQVDELALQILRHSELQESMAETLEERREAGGGTTKAIVEMAKSRSRATILAEWREAERRLAQSDIGSAEGGQAASDVRRLREEYRMSEGRIEPDRS